jgi:hypothetical protein
LQSLIAVDHGILLDLSFDAFVAANPHPFGLTEAQAAEFLGLGMRLCIRDALAVALERFEDAD